MIKIIHIPTLREVKETPSELNKLPVKVKAEIKGISCYQFNNQYGTVYFKTEEDAKKYLNQQTAYYIHPVKPDSIEVFVFNHHNFDDINKLEFTFVEVDDI